MATRAYWAKSVDVGACSSCGDRGMSTNVIVIRIETETGTWETRFCKHCAEQLIRDIEHRLREK